MDTKNCTKCKRTLPVAEFYRHPKMSDGILNTCKKCKILYNKQRRELPEVQAREREWENGLKHRIWTFLYRKKTQEADRQKQQKRLSILSGAMTPTTKTCSHCSRTLPILDFFRRPKLPDGLSSWCKKCIRAYDRAYDKNPQRQAYNRALTQKLRNNPEYQAKVRERTRKYRQRPEVKARKQELSKSPKYRAWAAQYSNRYYHTVHPERHKARQTMSNAIRDGRLERLPCVLCGNPKSEGHHEDYTRPLHVEWLCRSCHRKHRHGQDPVI